jgi:hypothetical protein
MYKVLKNTIVLGRQLKAGEIVSDLTNEQIQILVGMGRIEKTDEIPAQEEPVLEDRSEKPKRTRRKAK